MFPPRGKPPRFEPVTLSYPRNPRSSDLPVLPPAIPHSLLHGSRLRNRAHSFVAASPPTVVHPVVY